MSNLLRFHSETAHPVEFIYNKPVKGRARNKKLETNHMVVKLYLRLQF